VIFAAELASSAVFARGITTVSNGETNRRRDIQRHDSSAKKVKAQELPPRLSKEAKLLPWFAQRNLPAQLLSGVGRCRNSGRSPRIASVKEPVSQVRNPEKVQGFENFHDLVLARATSYRCCSKDRGLDNRPFGSSWRTRKKVRLRITRDFAGSSHLDAVEHLAHDTSSINALWA